MSEYVAQALELLSRDERFAPAITHIEIIPAQKPVFGELEIEEGSGIKKYLGVKNICLYQHQCRAIELLRKGENIIITTPTASGKTLAFNIPIFELLEKEPHATALYLYPAKALANDQLKFVTEFERISGIVVDPDIYDGDTPASRRSTIREKSRIIMSNPFELHLILPWHIKWRRFLSNLRFVVIDEAHRYRGVFGSNFAYLMRRFKRLCHHYGSSPQFILSSATVANPIEFSQKLVGEKFTLVSDDKSPKGRKFFILYNPHHNFDKGSSTFEATKKLLLHFVKNGVQTLCFTASRRMAELLATSTKKELEKINSTLADRIFAYRAGYLPEERRKLENSLKNGHIMGITSTNALELGIDIGSLDCVIISGFPGTLISIHQQAGRSGRLLEDSIVVLVAFPDPLDQYLVKHPERLFKQSVENATVDLTNPFIASGHILCAAAEMPINQTVDNRYFGEDLKSMLEDLAQAGLVQDTTRGWVYSARSRPHDTVTLENITSSIFAVLCDGELLETMDRAQAFRDGYQGAVIHHQGETYVVQEIDTKDCWIKVKKEAVDYFTQPVMVSDVRIVEELDRRFLRDFVIYFGTVSVTEQYVKYKKKRFDQVIGVEQIELPPINYRTKSLWWTISEKIENKVRDRGFDFQGSIHSLEHSLINILPFFVMCDMRDLGGLSTPNHPDTNQPAIFIYEGFEGGIGLSEKGYEIFDEAVKMAYDLITTCNCSDGCPSCIMSPKCGNDNWPLDKKGAIILLEELLRSLRPQSYDEPGQKYSPCKK